MCRSGVEGGRRCPSHSDPAKIAARNARRRELYAAKKHKKAAIVDIVENSAIPTHEKKVAYEDKQQNMNPVADHVETDMLKLGIKKNDVEEPEEGFTYRNYELSGTINYKHLDENSYKLFGFENHSEAAPWPKQPGITTIDMSTAEIKDFAKVEKAAIKAFTGLDFVFINNYAFHPEKIKNLDTGSEFTDVESHLAAGNNFLKLADNNQQGLFQITELMDSALEKGPKKQRVLYRGTKATSIGIKDWELNKWVDENRKIGTEFVFDGYTSTSVKKGTAASIGKGIVYEILTPEGVAVSKLSNVPDEDEVLLPRQQRYMVVGVHKNVKHATTYGTESTVVQVVAINSKGEILDGTNSDPIEPLEDIVNNLSKDEN